MNLEEALKVIMTNKDRVCFTYNDYILEIDRTVYGIQEDTILFVLKTIDHDW